MSFVSQFQFQKELDSHKTPEDTLRFLSSFESSVGKTFPGLKAFVQRGRACELQFQSFEFSGLKFELTFQTETKIDGRRLEMVDQKEPSKSIALYWEVKEGNSSIPATIDFKINLSFTVPLPSLTKRMVEPLIQKELTHFVERYSKHVEKALA